MPPQRWRRLSATCRSCSIADVAGALSNFAGASFNCCTASCRDLVVPPTLNAVSRQPAGLGNMFSKRRMLMVPWL